MRLVAVGSYFGAERPFAGLFKDIITIHNGENFKLTSDDVVIFGGGEDIWPGFYKQKANRYVRVEEPSRRDLFEEKVFQQAVEAGAKILGICRGAQLICALSGGSLIQHVTNHAGPDHDMATDDGRVIRVCSVHHQMMNPEGTVHKLIGWARNKISGVYLIEKEKNIEMPFEPEVVYFPKTRALGIQYHPEFMPFRDPAVQYARELVTKYLIEGEEHEHV